MDLDQARFAGGVICGFFSSFLFFFSFAVATSPFALLGYAQRRIGKFIPYFSSKRK
jgi:hypothetical protein